MPLLAAAGGVGLILDDIEFAAAARFDGFAGFLEEIGYRPGQGLYHGVTFVAFGEHAMAHLVVLAALNAAVAGLVWEVARRWLPVSHAVSMTIVWVLLSHRDATRFWISTGPNHVALILVLVGVLLVLTRGRDRRTLATVSALAFAAVCTYEGALGVAGLLVAWASWDRSLTGWVRRLAAAAAPIVGAALVIAWRSPRRGATRPFAGWQDSVGHHLRSVVPFPLDGLGPIVLVAIVGVGLVGYRSSKRRGDTSPVEFAPLVGVALVAAGLAPFLLGGFPIGPNGILDRGNLFADLGIAVIVGWGIATAAARLPADPLPRLALGVALVVFAAPAVFADVGDYRAAGSDVADLRGALATIEEPEAGVVEVQRPPNHGGVTAVAYRVQIADLYRLVHDQPAEPDWIRLTGTDPP